MLAGSVTLSWNVVDDVRDMLSYPFMVNAFRAGAIAAVFAAVLGWFMVLRRQAFAGHTLAVVGFPGAAAAVLLGVNVQLGYFGACVLAALVIGAAPDAGPGGHREEPVLIATVQSFALATGFLLVSRYGGNLTGATSLLFGTFFGVSHAEVITLLVVAVVGGTVLAFTARPLLFASIDGDVAAAGGVPTRALSIGFLVLLGLAAAEVSQITGSLLVFALLVLPAATAQRLSVRPSLSLVMSVAIGVGVTWLGLSAAFYSPYPSGFWITMFAFAAYVAAVAVRRTP